MPTTDDGRPIATGEAPAGNGADAGDDGRPGPPGSPGWAKAAKRYGPIVAVVALVAGAVVVFGGGGDDDDADSGGSTEIVSGDELIRSGPMTPQKAELEGRDDVDFGPHCDPETGRLAIPIRLVPPCVEPFTGDNGGATAQGVTADEVRIIYYATDPANDPLGAAMIGDIGADVDPDSAQQAIDAYVDLYNEYFETYGRTVVVERFVGSGASDDVEAARADALAIIEKKPFAVIGGPGQALSTFGPEIAAAGIVCGPACAGAAPESVIEEYAPYMWLVGPTPDQASALAAEMVANLAGPGPAVMAGDPALQQRDRRYAIVHYDTADGEHQPVFEAMRDALADQGIELTTDVEYQLDLARMQENARTMMTKLKDAGVTTVIFYGDPLSPSALTKEATAQGYAPEWILGPNVLADTTIFARSNDGQQWSHGFGMALNPARAERDLTDPFRIYRWAYGTEPPNNTVGVLEPRVRTMFAGIHMAGPELTPETLRDGLFRLPVGGGGPTTPQVSRGEHGVWPTLDWGGVDDVGVIWWDPTATGPDEVGREGTGMYRYASGGQRYTIGNLPGSPEEAGLFDLGSSVTVYDDVPEEDRVPDYPPPR
jgi:ABC-type branched-subunit amino acid transport system substrate-binding protein